MIGTLAYSVGAVGDKEKPSTFSTNPSVFSVNADGFSGDAGAFTTNADGFSINAGGFSIISSPGSATPGAISLKARGFKAKFGSHRAASRSHPRFIAC
jgi:hypothetical protein